MSISVTRRRIQRLGGSSLIVTLPKSWARKIGLRVGDEVVVVDEGDHLKILPPNSKLVRTLGSAYVRLAGYVKGIDPGLIAYCAYTRGFDRLVLELPKSNGLTPQAVASRLEKSPYILDARADYAGFTVEAAIDEAEEYTPKHLKTVASIVADLLAKASKGRLSEADLDTGLARVNEILDGLVRSAYKHKVLTCTGENADPLVIGGMRAAAALLKELLVHLAGDPGARQVATAVSRLATELLGGIANGSGKRILEVINGVPETITQIEESPADPRTKALATSLVRIIERLARDSLCPAILTEEE